MANRIAVFNHGTVVQIDSPRDLYHRPDTRFVADFVGSSNVIPTQFAGIGNDDRWASLRPEAIRIVTAGGRPATVTGHSFLGSTNRVLLESAGQRLQILVASDTAVPAVGDEVQIDWRQQDVHLMTGE